PLTTAAERHFPSLPADQPKPQVYYRHLPDRTWKGPAASSPGDGCAIQLPDRVLWVPGRCHRPHDISWLITDAYGQTLNSTFNRTIMLLGVTAYNHSSDVLSPSPGFVHRYRFYVCPGHMTNADYRYRCGGASDYFCKHWDCVSSGHIWWDPPMKGDYIRLQKGSEDVPCPGDGRGSWEKDDGWPLCNPVKISFTSEGMKYKGWEKGVTWGGRIYAAGYDYGNIFTITRRVVLPSSPPLGPNSKVVQYSFLQPRTSTPHPLLSLLNSTFSFLNASQPNWTTSCWLCTSAVPPFYEAVGSIKPLHE
uniref:Envelope glycoprotein n=1 Tax=Naja naja TaxID=35670 RepID=A0A8C6XNC2_NAJNA